MDEKRNDTVSNEFLDTTIIASFRNTINSSPVFCEHEEHKHRFNLICSFMDRIDSAVQYLNSHASTPSTEEGFITFLVFAAILRDGVNKLFENVFRFKPPYVEEKKYFANATKYNKPYFTEATCPTDDAFFEYLRAMAFAHPYEVSYRSDRRPFMEQGEKHYCPWVLVPDSHLFFGYNSDAVGVRIYSTIDDGIVDVTVSFSSLKEYLRQRYNCISELTEWAKQGIVEQNEEWKKTKVNRNQSPVDVFKEIIIILENRFENTEDFKNVLNYLTCPLSNSINTERVLLYRNAIEQAIPAICDCVDDLDSYGAEQVLAQLEVIPRNLHELAYYELSKIFSYLNERSESVDPMSNEAWGLKQAKEFYRDFAHKWVTIDCNTMPYDEIKLLVQVACFLEAAEQRNEE